MSQKSTTPLQHAEIRMLQQLSYERATLTPMAWVDIFRQRFTLRQQQLQGDLLNRLQLAVRADSLAFRSHLHSQPSWCGCQVCFCALMVDLCPVFSFGQLQFSTLLLPPFFSPFAVFFLFTLPALHNTHIGFCLFSLRILAGSHTKTVGEIFALRRTKWVSPCGALTGSSV